MADDRRSSRDAATIPYDPDILAPALDVVFCGINPAATAATAGHNFWSPSNRFWPVLHLAGFTDVRLRPEEERRLLEFGCGLTAAVARPTSRAAEVPNGEFLAAAASFEAKIRACSPRFIAFLGKRALAAMTADCDIRWGRQNDIFAGAIAWVLPNPSGLNRAFALSDLVTAYAELRSALSV
jgi:TDG/mug DNA glycosylase family protein